MADEKNREIPATMRCIVCHEPGDYRQEVCAVPEVEEEEVLVRTLAVGICAGDAKCFAGAPYFWGDKDHPRYVEPPVIPGHEFIGEVVKLGRGIPHYVYGFKQRSQGAMATYMKYVKGSIIYKVPKSIPPWKGVFIEPLACSIHAVERGDVQFEDVVVVSGCGPLGLGMVAAARLKNPKLLIALDLLDWKLDIASKCGAGVTLNPSKCDVVEEVKKLTDGYGCDVYIEATGHPLSVKQGLLIIARHGKFVEFSVFGKETSVDWTIISDAKELTIRGGHLGPYCYPKAISMIENNQLAMEDIVTHKLKMEEVVKGIELVNNSRESVKVVLLPE